MTRAVRAGMDFVSALDRGSLTGVERLCAPGATWWVDGGPDREGGDPHGKGTGRFPLHGVMRMDDKLALMRELGPTAFPTGCRQIPRRVIAGEDACVIEVEGYGVHAGGAEYANRYGFVFDVDAGGAITSVREYLDTLHAQEVVGAGERVPASRNVRHLTGLDHDGAPPAVAAALRMWPALAVGDLATFGALFRADATWWTDSGRDRALGRLHRTGDIAASPLHGVVPIADKLAAMRRRLADGAYASAAVTVTPHRWIADDTLVAIEATGDATLTGGAARGPARDATDDAARDATDDAARTGGGARYQNRYLWIVDVRPDGIAQVREYCDTLHIADLMGVA